MTLVNLTALSTMLGEPGLVGEGYLRLTYWAGNAPYIDVDGDSVTFPAPIELAIADGATESALDVAPTGGVCCVRWDIRANQGGLLTRYTTIPDTGPVDFGNLPTVDPATFAPAESPSVLDYISQFIQDNYFDRI